MGWQYSAFILLAKLSVLVNKVQNVHATSSLSDNGGENFHMFPTG